MRTCGNCIACCTYLSCKEVPKEPLTDCHHSLPGGTVTMSLDGVPMHFNGTHDLDEDNGGNCMIYAERPNACQFYACVWLAGHGEEEDRPDRSGVLIDTARQIENAVECKSLWLGSESEPAGVAAIERISRSIGRPVLVAEFCEKRLIRVVGRPI